MSETLQQPEVIPFKDAVRDLMIWMQPAMIDSAPNYHTIQPLYRLLTTILKSDPNDKIPDDYAGLHFKAQEIDPVDPTKHREISIPLPSTCGEVVASLKQFQKTGTFPAIPPAINFSYANPKGVSYESKNKLSANDIAEELGAIRVDERFTQTHTELRSMLERLAVLQSQAPNTIKQEIDTLLSVLKKKYLHSIKQYLGTLSIQERTSFKATIYNELYATGKNRVLSHDDWREIDRL